jgi:LmbE family N-acetylglucosaminyl deacetylase
MSDLSSHTPRILAIGAHPDDCDEKAGGCAFLWVNAGFTVKFVSTTNGEAGHHEMSGEALVERRKAEAAAVAQLAGIDYEVLDNPDGQLVPGLKERMELIRLIREFRPDLILTHRPNDYHPDHRYTSQLVQDCAYLVCVPNICPETPRMENMPVMAYFSDHFEKPIPFQPDVAVDIDPVRDEKLRMLDCHESQVYEWLPWIDQHGIPFPENPDKRLDVLYEFNHQFTNPTPEIRECLIQYYGEERARNVADAESFEACEYGRPLDEEAIRRFFPFLPSV